MKKFSTNPFLEISLAAIIWGSNGIFVKYLNLPVVTISFFRLSVPTIILFFILSFKGVRLFKGDNKLILLASLFNAVRQFLYFVGFTFTSIGNAIILHYTYPLFTAIFSKKYLQEKTDKKSIIFVILAFIGVAAMYLNKELSFTNRDFIGMTAVTLASAVYAASLIIFKKSTEKYSKYETIFYQNVLGAFIFAPLIFFFPLPNLKQASIASLQAILTGLISFALFFSGLRKIKASTASFICYLEVVSAVFFAYIFFREIPTWNMMIGGVLIVTSTFVLSKKDTTIENNMI